jgi:predicted Zn-dependent protease
MCRIGQGALLSALLVCLGSSPGTASAVCPGEFERTQAMIQRIEQEFPLRASSDELSRYIQRLGMDLVRASGRGSKLSWRFLVQRDYSINAFSIGSGYVYVSDGTVSAVKNEDELAAIIAHEIGHQLVGHFCDRPGAGAYTGLTGIFNWPWSESSQQYGVERQQVGSLTQEIDPRKEEEADRYATRILEAAGFDPRAMLDVARSLPNRANFMHLKDRRRIGSLEGLLAGLESKPRRHYSVEFKRLRRSLAGK